MGFAMFNNKEVAFNIIDASPLHKVALMRYVANDGCSAPAEKITKAECIEAIKDYNTFTVAMDESTLATMGCYKDIFTNEEELGNKDMISILFASPVNGDEILATV